MALRRAETRYLSEKLRRSAYLGRGCWTPPLALLDAYSLEAGLIRSLGLNPLVVLTDHDDLEAPMSLRAVNARRTVPVSVEWTVPTGGTFVHLGVHNLPPLKARSIIGATAGVHGHAPRLCSQGAALLAAASRTEELQPI
jgi:hypothetical protein